MKAFTNTPITKKKLLQHLESHKKADAFIKGSYSNKISNTPPKPFSYRYFKGCAIGCAVNSVNLELGNNEFIGNSDHKALSRRLNIPSDILYLIDNMFETMSINEGENLMIDFIKNVKIGSDLSVIKCINYTVNTNTYLFSIKFNEEIVETYSSIKARDTLFKILKEI